jgi:Hypervirulence associated proteins TUDOR domain
MIAMPVGGGGKPAGGYRAGKKGSYGCSGYPTVSADGTVHGCHKTKEEAATQARAIWASVNSTKADDMPLEDFMDIEKALDITEGDYVMGMTMDGIVVGQVEHVMTEGGTYGTPGTALAIESTPEDPAMAVRVFEEEDGMYYPTPYSIGMLYSQAKKISQPPMGDMQDDMQEDSLEMSMDEEDERYGRHRNEMHKADSYTPTSGMKSAAARAIRWKEEGKATGAGTPVGWGRARDIVAGRSMSLSVVKRMYSFFSRHEVDKKGKDFYNTSNPSNGRIMWDAWGGDAGYSWSRGIVNRMKDKALFADFGKDYTKAERMVVKAMGVGSMVSWNSSGGRATGKIVRIIRNGTYNVPNSDFTITGTQDNPAVAIRVYQDGKPTDTIVGHRMNTLRSA